MDNVGFLVYFFLNELNYYNYVYKYLKIYEENFILQFTLEIKYFFSRDFVLYFVIEEVVRKG